MDKNLLDKWNETYKLVENVYIEVTNRINEGEMDNDEVEWHMERDISEVLDEFGEYIKEHYGE